MTATIESLTIAITAKSIALSKLLAAKSVPEPTFGESGCDQYGGEDVEVRNARLELARAAHDLASLAQSPEDHILQLAWSSADTTNLAVLLRFSLAQLVPLNGSIGSQDLATAANLPVDIINRTIRYAITNGLFEEASLGTFKHNASSALLARNEFLRDIAITGTGQLSYVLLHLADALEQQQKLPPEKGGPAAAFNLAYPDSHNVFEHLSKDPVAAGKYHKYMVGRHNTSRWALPHLIAAYDWPSIGTQTVVDAGGSSGHTALALSSVCPGATFIVQDVDPVALEAGKRTVAGIDSELAKRVEWQVHDLFEPQQVKAGFYIFRHVFHDWSDEDVARMVKALVPALEEDARVLISDGIMPGKPQSRASGVLDEKQIM
ncbi:MAG: hypothetical protein LQ352_007576 [Teloschistes flavicans]|nr:MAG: hypothetical protein LQ352_007576 [Teloschistes flavicans]